MRSSKNVKSSVIATAAAVTIAVTGLAGTSNEVSTPIAPTTELIETATTEAIIATETEFVETVETATEAPSMELEVFSDLAANELPPEDMALYAGIVAAETYSWWDYQGYKMIADVIRNRVEHPAFAECTVRDVITAPNQFTTYSNGNWLTVVPNESQVQATIDAANGVNMTLPPDVVFFCTREYYEANPGNWFETLPYYGSYDNTMFFYHSSWGGE